MNDSHVPQKLANVAVTGTWLTWFMANVVEINEVLQFVALAVAIVSSVLAARFYIRNTNK